MTIKFLWNDFHECLEFSSDCPSTFHHKRAWLHWRWFYWRHQKMEQLWNTGQRTDQLSSSNPSLSVLQLLCPKSLKEGEEEEKELIVWSCNSHLIMVARPHSVQQDTHKSTTRIINQEKLDPKWYIFFQNLFSSML